MHWKDVLKKLGIALVFLVVAVFLTGATTFSWLLAIGIFYVELRFVK